ncbi:MAG: PilZ domain-containing protein [Candidatus Omnitrophota bacterium]|jgi:hypothetical protein
MSWDGSEKRRVLRINLPCRIIIYTPQAETIDTVINNISEGGVGFTLFRELEISSKIGLEIYEIKQEPVVCRAQVRWVNLIESTYLRGRILYNIGVQFTQINSQDLLVIKKLVESKNSREG